MTPLTTKVELEKIDFKKEEKEEGGGKKSKKVSLRLGFCFFFCNVSKCQLHATGCLPRSLTSATNPWGGDEATPSQPPFPSLRLVYQEDELAPYLFIFFWGGGPGCQKYACPAMLLRRRLHASSKPWLFKKLLLFPFWKLSCLSFWLQAFDAWGWGVR